MLKTPKQEILELRNGMPIEDLLRATLEKFRGRHNRATLAAVFLEVSTATLYNWCAQYGIDINEYRTDEMQDPRVMEELKQKVTA